MIGADLSELVDKVELFDRLNGSGTSDVAHMTNHFFRAQILKKTRLVNTCFKDCREWVGFGVQLLELCPVGKHCIFVICAVHTQRLHLEELMALLSCVIIRVGVRKINSNIQ